MSPHNQRYVSTVALAVIIFLLPFVFQVIISQTPSTASALSVPSNPQNSVISVALANRIADPRPRFISIPSINLNRRIVDVGTTTEGRLDVPPNYIDVGWYKYGVIPGEVGNAVIDAHVDDGGLVAGPFKRLRSVIVGDRIMVTSADGLLRTFVVIDTHVYPLEQFPSDLVFNERSGSFLKIITCSGNFQQKENDYDQRLIVTAKLVE